jgi:hypothetical protein
VTAGGSNAVRWFTAFIRGRVRQAPSQGLQGDPRGVARRRVDLDDDLHRPHRRHPKQDGLLKFVLEVKSSAEDLKKKIFVQNPHGSILRVPRGVLPAAAAEGLGAGSCR